MNISGYDSNEAGSASFNDSDNDLPNRKSRSFPSVSIIVPIKNEAEMIEQCLKSLLNLDYEGYELLIVDTGSTDGTCQKVEEIARNNRKVRLLRANGNAAMGRNIGIAAARGDVVAFIDGDCIATKNWLRTLVDSLVEEPTTTAGVGGPNIPLNRKENTWSQAVDAILGTFLGSGGSVQVRTNTKGYVRSLSTANSAFRVENVRRIGGFDPRLGPCEDSDFCARSVRAGSKLRFVRDATVYHHREYHSLKKFGQHMFGYGQARGKAILVKPATNISLTSLAITSSATFVVLLLILSVAGSNLAELLLLGSVFVYLLLIISYSVALSKGLLSLFAATIPAFLILHASYATGLITGMVSSLPRIVNNRHRRKA